MSRSCCRSTSGASPAQDRHWTLRQRTAAFVGITFVSGRPLHGPASREFHRYQDFRRHYDRWLPVDSDAHATAIMWSAG